MTLEEYARWYVALPTVDEYAAAPDRMADSIRRWSKRLGFDRRRPVRDALFALEQDLPGMRPDPQGRR